MYTEAKKTMRNPLEMKRLSLGKALIISVLIIEHGNDLLYLQITVMMYNHQE